MAVTEEKILKTQSEAFLSIRKRVQSHMKKNNISYSQVLESIEENERNGK
ncbi:hypothetical protein [Priestia koreensis]|nr:hypothetical protein [Priestia koreensis]